MEMNGDRINTLILIASLDLVHSMSGFDLSYPSDIFVEQISCSSVEEVAHKDLYLSKVDSTHS